MNRDQILKALFGGGWKAEYLEADHFYGRASVGNQEVTVIGTAEKAEVGADMALTMARVVIQTIKERAGEPIVFLLDTQGQRLRRRDELMGLNGYMAHLAKVVELARQKGHVIVSVVYGEAVSGGYISTGMMADACYALADAEIKVMNLPAMSRITKIPLDHLQELAKQSPVFSPGVENYLRMGHLDAVWQGDYAAQLATALFTLQSKSKAEIAVDSRIARGVERGGRMAAGVVIDRVLGHA
jgi:malonate decarboxylase gamma subunit